jgi:hypothetical protein
VEVVWRFLSNAGRQVWVLRLSGSTLNTTPQALRHDRYCHPEASWSGHIILGVRMYDKPENACNFSGPPREP